MNYRKLANKFIAAGYLEAEEDSKLHRVGRKVMRVRNQQVTNGRFVKSLGRPDPVWLSAYNL
jgi:hypothetical protein